MSIRDYTTITVTPPKHADSMKLAIEKSGLDYIIKVARLYSEDDLSWYRVTGILRADETPAAGVLKTEAEWHASLNDSVLWCFTHDRIPEDGLHLCGDEWRDIGSCRYGQVFIVESESA